MSSEQSSGRRSVVKTLGHGDDLYRIVLKEPNGDLLPLIAQSNLAAALDRLRDIMESPDTTYPDGWVERARIKWERCS